MKRFLAFVSFFLLLFTPLASQDLEVQKPSSEKITEGVHFKDSITSQEYNILIHVRGNDITGLCLMNIDKNDDVIGSVINEFGVTAFDFTSNGGKVKILNALKKINKWYIKRVLSKDIAFFLSNRSSMNDVNIGKREIKFDSTGSITVINKRFKIRYEFTPQNQQLYEIDK